MEQFDEGSSQRFRDDDFFVVANDTIDDVQVFPTIVVVGIDSLQIFGCLSNESISDTSQVGVFHGHHSQCVFAHEVSHCIR